MNRVFKLLWNKSQGTWVAVSEIAMSRGSRASSSCTKGEFRKNILPLSTFRFKPFISVLSLALSLTLGFSQLAMASVVFKTIDSNTDGLSLGTMNLSQTYLGNSTLSNPTQLSVGYTPFKYAVVMFRPSEDGQYIFGQTTSPVDTIMIVYEGGFDPNAPGIGAIRGNDDTSDTTHRNTLGSQAPSLIKCGPSTSYCPQVTVNVRAGQVYTLLVSVYSQSYNSSFTIPFDFYSNRDGQFASRSDLSPIDTNESHYVSSELDFSVKREFKGGELKMDLATGTYSLSFTVHNEADFDPSLGGNRIDQNGNVSTFSGVLKDCDSSCSLPGDPHTPASGAIKIVNSGTGGKVIFSGNNTYSGGTTIDNNATLSISADKNLGATTGSLTLTGGTLENTAAMSSNRQVILGAGNGTFDTQADLTLNGQISHVDNGGLIKTGNASLTLTHSSNVVDHVDVKNGTLNLAQSGILSTTGDYTTHDGATTKLGGVNSTLDIGGVLTQQNNARLDVVLSGNQNDIKADSAVLGGTLHLSGFGTEAGATSSQILSGSYNYTLIHTNSGISGDFSNSNYIQSNLDYLLNSGYVDGNDYKLGFRLAWTNGGTSQGTGDFTLGANTAFEIDTVLENQSGSFSTGWSGQDLNKDGVGTLILSKDNTYTGKTTIEEGTLVLKDEGSIASSSEVKIEGDNAILDISAVTNGSTINNLNGANAGSQVVLGDQNLTVNNSSDTSFAGSITGNGELIKTGNGELTLTGENTYTGLTTINTGTLQLGNGGTGGMIAGDIANNTTLIFNRNDYAQYDGKLSGDGDLIKKNYNTIFLTQNGSSQGSVDVQSGVLDFAQSGIFTTTGDLTTQSNAITSISAGGRLEVGGKFEQKNDSTLNVTLAFSGPEIIAENVSLNGALTVNGFVDAPEPIKASEVFANRYNLIQSTNDISGDFSNYYNGNQLDTGLDYLLNDGFITTDKKRFEMGFRLAWNEGGQNHGTGSFTMAAGTGFDVDMVLADKTLPSGGYVSTWDGKSLTKAGEGRLVLSAQNTYTGKTMVEEGMLELKGAGDISRSQALELGSNATFKISDISGDSATIRNLASDATDSSIQLGGKNLVVNNLTASDNTHFAGVITGTGGLIKEGEGTFAISQQAAYSGATTVNHGLLQLMTDDAIAQSGNVVVNADIYVDDTNQTFHHLSGNSSGRILQGNGILTVDNSNQDTSYAGSIQSNGYLVKKGAGNLTLSGATRWTGGIALDEGSLTLDGSTGGAQLAGNVIGQDGTRLELRNGALLKGWIDPTDVSVNNASWIMTADSIVNDLTMSNNGVVSFEAPNGGAFKTLNVEGKLSGNGIFHMNTNVAAQEGDLIFANATEGAHTLVFKNAGGTPSNPEQFFKVVDVATPGASQARFSTLGNKGADVGAYKYKLVTGEEVGADAGDWYLTLTKQHSNLTQEVLAAASAAKYATMASLNSLHKRMGELRLEDKHEGGLWTRAYHKDYTMNLSEKVDQNVNGMEIGADKRFNIDQGRVYVGGMVGYGNSKSKTGSSDSDNSKNHQIGAYASWIFDNGAYIDLVGRNFWFKRDYNILPSGSVSAITANGIKKNVWSLDAEVGKRFEFGSGQWFVEPQLELNWISAGSSDFEMSDGQKIHFDQHNVLNSRFGMALGKRFESHNGLKHQLYSRLDWTKDLYSKGKVSVGDERFDTYKDEGSFVAAVGYQTSGKQLSFHVELERTINSPTVKENLGINAGMRWAF